MVNNGRTNLVFKTDKYLTWEKPTEWKRHICRNVNCDKYHVNNTQCLISFYKINKTG